MYSIAFEPITGALTMFAFQHACHTRQSRIIPHARVLLRRHSEIFAESVMDELAEQFVDITNGVDIANVQTVVALMLILVVVRAFPWEKFLGPAQPRRLRSMGDHQL